jgi:hypothetical protein
MTADRDIGRILDHWLLDGPTTAPDRVLDVLTDRIERQPQRPAWRLDRRLLEMNPYLKIGLAAAAVILVAVIGYNLFPASSSDVGGPTPVQPSIGPLPSSSPIPSTPAYVWPGSLEAGTYTTRLIWDLPFDLRFTVPAGWQSRDVEVIRDPTLAVAFHLAGNVYSDPCGRVLSDPPIGPSVDDLAEALAAMPGFDTTAPTPVSVDGVAIGRYLEMTVRADAGCTNPGLWADPPDSYNGAGPVGPPSWGAEQPHMRIWILDVDGVRLVVSALSSATATAADRAELQAVIDSVRIVRPEASPAPLPAP